MQFVKINNSTIPNQVTQSPLAKCTAAQAHNIIIALEDLIYYWTVFPFFTGEKHIEVGSDESAQYHYN